MTDHSTVDAYERVSIPLTQRSTSYTSLFLYVAHFKDANYLQIGFGTESASGLQRAHLAGPQVHELHLNHLVAWLKHGSICIGDADEKRHPFSSVFNVDLPQRLAAADTMWLHVGKFLPLISNAVVPPHVVRAFADAVDRVRIKAFGHPADWDVQFYELRDGRFMWLAYDSDLDKIRIGMGFHNDANEKQFGVHSYAVGKRDAATYGVFHFGWPGSPIQFAGLPPRWPSSLTPFLHGEQKKRFAVEFLRLADKVWPGGVALPAE